MKEMVKYHIIVNWGSESKQALFEEIGKFALYNGIASSKEEIVRRLHKRDAVGNIQIADHVVLPHLQSTAIHQSYILFIRLNKPIVEWNAMIKDIRLIVVILLKEDEAGTIKKNITMIMRKLADDNFIKMLLSEENLIVIENIVKDLIM